MAAFDVGLPPTAPVVRIADVFRLLLSSWRALAIITFAVTASAAGYAMFSTPIYRAAALLAPAGGDRSLMGGNAALGQLSGLASLAGINLEAKDSNTEEALAVLHSREFLQRFITDHQLVARIFPKYWDAANRRWRVTAERQPTVAKAFRYFSDRVLSVSKDRKTGLVSVAVEWHDRQEAADWANELVSRVNAEMRSRAIENVDAYRSYLEKELAKTQLVSTRDSISRLIELQIRQGMIATVTQEYAFRTVDRALPPDADDIVRPKRVAIVVGGVIGGMFIACMFVLGRAVGQSIFSASRRKGQPGHAN
jgi:uncharacterized protein involved in exopolysaccharide biosynthesis